MKRILSIFLILCLIAPVGCSFTYLQLKRYHTQKQVKRRMINGMDKSQLVLLKFSHIESKSELRWEHSREFEYKDEMYDVVEKKSTVDSVQYWCWWDHEETALNRSLHKLVSKELRRDAAGKETSRRLYKLLESFYLEIPGAQPVAITGKETDVPKLPCNLYFLCMQAPPTPPPENSCSFHLNG